MKGREPKAAWIGAPEAAARLGLGMRPFYRLIDSGALPAYRMGRVIRLRSSDVDAYLEQHGPGEGPPGEGPPGAGRPG